MIELIKMDSIDKNHQEEIQANKELYVLVCNGLEWEDLVIFDNKEEAIKELQKHNDNYRIEVMKYENNKFIPAYRRYQ